MDCQHRSGKRLGFKIKMLDKSFNIEETFNFLKNEKLIKKQMEGASKWKNIEFYKKKGCQQCNNEGYKGRLGIYEVLEISEPIEKLISSSASTETIQRKAKEDGMANMLEDGLIKVIQGLTSIEEVLRVTKT